MSCAECKLLNFGAEPFGYCNMCRLYLCPECIKRHFENFVCRECRDVFCIVNEAENDTCVNCNMRDTLPRALCMTCGAQRITLDYCDMCDYNLCAKCICAHHSIYTCYRCNRRQCITEFDEDTMCFSCRIHEAARWLGGGYDNSKYRSYHIS